MKDLLEAGVHFGHQTRRWNPKMKRYIYGSRNGIYIIDLHQSLKLFDDAQKYVQDIVLGGGSILFVGTKKQASDAVQEAAVRSRQYFVNQRWLGGMLTNFRTIQSRIGRLRELEMMEREGIFLKLTKKEAAILTEEKETLEVRVKALERQENHLKERYTEMQKELSDALQAAGVATSGGPP